MATSAQHAAFNNTNLGRAVCTCYTRIACDTYSMLAIRLDKQIEERLARLARRTGRTKTFYAREAILEHLDDMEDSFLAIQRIQAKEQTYPLDEVKRELGL